MKMFKIRVVTTTTSTRSRVLSVPAEDASAIENKSYSDLRAMAVARDYETTPPGTKVYVAEVLSEEEVAPPLRGRPLPLVQPDPTAQAMGDDD